MSRNSELVTFFMDETFRTYKDNLGRYVGADFVFKSSRFGELNFEDYVKYAAQYYREDKVEIKWIHSTDDVNFGVAYMVVEKSGQQVFGILAVTLNDGLVSIVAE